MEDWKKTLTDILQQEVTQEAMAEGNKTPEQEAVDFIEQELSKAREEGRREGFIFGYGKGEHSMSEFLEHKWDIPHSSRMSAIPDEEIDKALESLTKLTNK